MFELRDYQKEAIQKARVSFGKGNKRICLTLATGSGKSPIAREIISMFRAKNPKGKIAYFTFRNVLINQMRETLKGLDVEIDTLQGKGRTETELYDLVIIDEVHYASTSKLQNNIKSKFTLGLSATPIDSYGNALEFDEIIDVVQLVDLIEMGYAAPVKVMANSNIDTSSLKSRAGDFVTDEAFGMMSKSSVTRNIIDTYMKHAKGLKTIVYAVNIEHCEQLRDDFLAAGVNCDSVHSKKSDSMKALQDFKDNKIEMLINVDVLTTGLDFPDIYCLLLASPTKSVIKAVQIYGRATRLNPLDKDKVALILDCAEVIKNTVHPLQRLDFTKKKSDKTKYCKECQSVLKIMDKHIETISEFEYKITSFFKCDNGHDSVEEELKLINMSVCEQCSEIFENDGAMQLEHRKDSVGFMLKCKCCGYLREFREILYTDTELKEITLKQAIESGATWDDVRVILKAEAKKSGYHHRWVTRAMETLQDKGKTPKEVIEAIKTLSSRNKKIGGILYM